ncbi:MAG: 30S ribosomal protein S6 [Alphaproteobacteria bacterium]|jgi:small subunit ribosomal protein S6|nr:30S ribosomal protein S6 [Alphaproteobacteria bacterium]
MRLYETTFIARQDISPAQVETLTESLVGVLKENGGSVGKTEYCGLRVMTYPIRKNKRGHYVLMNVSASSDALQELERRMRLNEDVLRYLSVQVEEHEEGPSALLKATRYGREDNERRPRYEGGAPQRSRYMSDRPSRQSDEGQEEASQE